MRLRVARVTEAHRAKWRSWTQEQAQTAFLHGQAAIASGDDDGARRWFERSRRISGGAPQVEFALAMSRLRTGDAAGAADLLDRLLRRYDFREGWTALATARHRLGAHRGAARALTQALSRHAPAGWLLARMDAIARDRRMARLVRARRQRPSAGRRRRRLRAGPAPRGRWWMACPSRACRWTGAGAWYAASRWTAARRGAARQPARHRLDPALRGLRRMRSMAAGELEGWLWHPGEAERAPLLTIEAADGSLRLASAEGRLQPRLSSQASRRSPVRVRSRDPGGAAGLPCAGPLRHRSGRTGGTWLGSPLDPSAERRSAALLAGFTASCGARPAGCVPRPTARSRPSSRCSERHRRPASAAPVRAPTGSRSSSPCYRGLAHTIACLRSPVFATVAASRGSGAS